MNEKELIKILTETAIKFAQEYDKKRCGNLIYSKSDRIREPELRDVLSKVLTNRNIDYGIEVDTDEKYGKLKYAGRIDLSIYKANIPNIHIELKVGQSKVDEIEKDFQKIMQENVEGSCFFHEIENLTGLKRLQEKYEEAYKIHKKIKNHIKWFLLYIFDASHKQAFYHFEKNICDIKDFKLTTITL